MEILFRKGISRYNMAFFNPQEVVNSGGIDPLFKGMATQIQQKLDCHVIDDVRKFFVWTTTGRIGWT